MAENKYKKWYFNIITNALSRQTEGYCEMHHIIPRCMGGSDENHNLVALTAREHFICHILLTKFVIGKAAHEKLIKSVIFMKSSNNYQNRYINGRLFETAKKEYAEHKRLIMSGESNSFYGKKHTEETRLKMSASKKANYSNGKHPHIGMKRSAETKANISRAKKGKPSTKKGLPQKPATPEQRQRHKESLQGTSFWWTNGIESVRGAKCPDETYKRGRTMTNLSKNITINYYRVQI